MLPRVTKITILLIHIAYYEVRKALNMSAEADGIEATLLYLPMLSEQGTLLDNASASQVRAIIERQSGGLGHLLEIQITAVTDMARTELTRNEEGHLVLTAEQLRGLVARSAIHGASQALYATAESLEQAHLLDQMVNGAEPTA
ncbi:hypothetical protein BH10PAT3_BH10PAT3_5630 [soil metagenome]